MPVNVPHAKSAAKSTVLQHKGVKRVRFQDLATVKDAELKLKLACMVSTRSSKRAKPLAPSQVSLDESQLQQTAALPPAAKQHHDAVHDEAQVVSTSDDELEACDPVTPWNDKVDRMVDPQVFLEVQSQVDRPFTMDAFARSDGSNALCQHFCSPDRSFFEADLTGQMLWVHPPHDMVEPMFEHYFKNKTPSTGAVFVVSKPNVTNPESWVQYTKKMKLIREFTRGMHLFCGLAPSCTHCGRGHECCFI
jgi:hypothetical protein